MVWGVTWLGTTGAGPIATPPGARRNPPAANASAMEMKISLRTGPRISSTRVALKARDGGRGPAAVREGKSGTWCSSRSWEAREDVDVPTPIKADDHLVGDGGGGALLCSSVEADGRRRKAPPRPGILCPVGAEERL